MDDDDEDEDDDDAGIWVVQSSSAGNQFDGSLARYHRGVATCLTFEYGLPDRETLRFWLFY